VPSISNLMPYGARAVIDNYVSEGENSL